MHYCLLYNIKYIVAYDNSGETADQLAALNAFSKHFKKVFEFGLTRKFHIFEVLHDTDPTWCRVGAAQVEAGINRIKVTLSDPTQPVLLRYRFAEGMRVDNPHITVKAQAITTGFGPAQQHIDDFILVDPDPKNTSKEVIISFRKWF